MAARRTRRSRSTTLEGGVWHDGGGKPWLNQYSPGAWNYLISLAKAAATPGVDEVQFDYVRFPSEGNLADDALPAQGQAEPMNATIPRFLAAARKALKPYDVKLGVDVFGLAADHDLGIGQDVALIAKHVDVDLPDALPEPLHARASSASTIPNADPSSTVALSMGDIPLAADRLAERQDPALAAGLRRLRRCRRCSAQINAADAPGRDRLDALERRRWTTRGARSAGSRRA